MDKNIKKYTIISILIIIVIVISIVIINNIRNSVINSNIEKETHVDIREESCKWKTIKSIEYNINEKECFETIISSCNIPTFTSIDECKKLNWINTINDENVLKEYFNK